MLLSLISLLLQAVQLPAPRGLVNDFAGVVGASASARIERVAQDVRDKSGGEIAVVTLPDIGVRDVSDVALQIGREWKVGRAARIGDRTRNAGAVVLLVPRETSGDGRGHCWVATGQGAEGFITDADAGDICREATPLFRQREYGAGLELVTLRVAQRFAQEFGFALDTALRAPALPRGQPQRSSDGISPTLLLIAFVVLLVLLSSSRRRRGCLPFFIWPGGGWGGGGWHGGGGFGGGSGGGFGGFGGGGGFSGGGGGSSW